MINFANSYHKYVNRFLEINEAAKEAPAELIRQVEGAYRSAVQEVAQEVFSLKNDCKVIMLPWPVWERKNHYSSYFAEIA